jgi:hypothetical protein
MAQLTELERRNRLRDAADQTKVVLVCAEDEQKLGACLKAKPIDYSGTGMGLETEKALEVGSLVVLRTYVPEKDAFGLGYASAKVMWCRQYEADSFRAGVAFTDPLTD